MKMVVDNSKAGAEAEADVRSWLNVHRETEGLTWVEIGKLSDVPSSTLSAFSSGKYGGDNAKVAAKITAYRDRLSAQAGAHELERLHLRSALQDDAQVVLELLRGLADRLIAWQQATTAQPQQAQALQLQHGLRLEAEADECV